LQQTQNGFLKKADWACLCWIQHLGLLLWSWPNLIWWSQEGPTCL